MYYEVQTVADHELPDGLDHVIIERTDHPPLLIVAGAPARVWSWMREWEDMREAPTESSVLIPLQRAARAVAV